MRILRVNSRTKNIKFLECTDEEMKYGGRSFIAYHMMKEVDPECDPIGPKNKLIISNGLLGDTPPDNGRPPWNRREKSVNRRNKRSQCWRNRPERDSLNSG